MDYINKWSGPEEYNLGSTTEIIFQLSLRMLVEYKGYYLSVSIILLYMTGCKALGIVCVVGKVRLDYRG